MVKKKFDFELAYYKYRKIRRTEEKIIEIYDTDKIKSPFHLSIVQESKVGIYSSAISRCLEDEFYPSPQSITFEAYKMVTNKVDWVSRESSEIIEFKGPF